MSIDTIGVVGAGQMGAGIAHVAAVTPCRPPGRRRRLPAVITTLPPRSTKRSSLSLTSSRLMPDSKKSDDTTITLYRARSQRGASDLRISMPSPKGVSERNPRSSVNSELSTYDGSASVINPWLK